MKNKLVLATLMLALCLALGGGSLAQAQTSTGNTSATTSSTTTTSTSLWQQFVDWLSSFNRGSGGGQCPVRICGTDPDPK